MTVCSARTTPLATLACKARVASTVQRERSYDGREKMRHVVVLRRTLTGKIVVAGKTDGQQLLAVSLTGNHDLARQSSAQNDNVTHLLPTVIRTLSLYRTGDTCLARQRRQWRRPGGANGHTPVSYTHLRAHE